MPQKLFNCINAVPINLLMMTPSLFMSLSDSDKKYICQGESKIQDLVLGGEAFPESLFSIQPNIRLWNIYGTTECSVWAFMGLAQSSPVPLGEPLGSTEWSIEDNRLYLGGLGRLCYIDDEKEPLLLRDTGDLVRKDLDSLFFLGRSDSIIKRHGYRIHLGQIAQAVQALNIFQQYEIVYLHQDDIDEIICFYVGPAISEDFIRGKLVDHLPWYSIPSLFRVGNFPLSMHGKLDTRALKETYSASLNSCTSLSLEEIIARRLNLKTEDLDTNRHFLANGGSSFSATMVVQEVIISLGVNRLPESKRIKAHLLNSLLHDKINVFMDLARRSHPKVYEVDKENLSLALNTNLTKNLCGNSSGALNLKWKMNLEKCIDASPIIHNDTVFIGSHSGLFAAIDCYSGSLKWKKRFPDRIEGTAAVSPDSSIVVFGCYDHYIYSVCSVSGNIISKFATKDIVKACPIFDLENRYIWIGSYDHLLYCIDPATGDLVYSFDLESSVCSKCCIDYNAKRIIASTNRGNIFSLQIEGGDIQIQWKMHLGPIFSDPLLDEKSGDLFISCTDDNLYKLCGDNGSIIWKVSTNGPMFSSPKFWSEDIVVGSHASNLSLISKNDGRVLKSFKSDSPVFSSPLIFQDKCCFTSIEGIMYVLSRTEEISFFQLHAKAFSSPIYHDSTVYVGSRDNHIYAISVSQST
jgi:acyl-CoA synthetase